MKFGRYTIIKKIAQGGMAEIFLARQESMEGFALQIVLKKILPHLSSNAEFVRMLIDEAKIAAMLNHPNIVQIYDLGQVEGHYYIAMEYVHGQDLRHFLQWYKKRESKMPWLAACRIISQACDGMNHAHRLKNSRGEMLNLVHRDLSPQNILIGEQGEVKIIDFGIAKAHGKLSETQAGRIKGKYSYMSPEQVSGKPIDSRSDIFSLGIVFWEMVTGRYLFTSDSPLATAKAVAEMAIPPIREIDPELPAEIERIIARALTRDPDSRYQQTMEMRTEIEDFLKESGQTITRADLLKIFQESGAFDLSEPESTEPEGPSLNLENDRPSLLQLGEDSMPSSTQFESQDNLATGGQIPLMNLNENIEDQPGPTKKPELPSGSLLTSSSWPEDEESSGLGSQIPVMERDSRMRDIPSEKPAKPSPIRFGGQSDQSDGSTLQTSKEPITAPAPMGHSKRPGPRKGARRKGRSGRWWKILLVLTVVLGSAISGLASYYLSLEPALTPTYRELASDEHPVKDQGLLLITSRPEVLTNLDGQKIKTPYKRNVTPGDHRVEFIDESLNLKKTVTISVETGRAAELSPEFNGYLFTLAYPRTKMLLDGQLIGQSLFLFRKLPAGSHELKLIQPGLEPKQVPAKIKINGLTFQHQLNIIDPLVLRDQRWSKALNQGLINPVADKVLPLLISIRSLYLALAVLAFFFIWMRSAKGRALSIAALGSGIISELLSSFAFQPLWERARPCLGMIDQIRQVPGLDCLPTPGFPSAVAAGITAIGIVLLGLGWRWSPLPILTVALVGFAPIYCGQAYPTDVLAGFGIGGVIGLIGLVFARLFMKEKRQKYKPLPSQWVGPRNL